ncbi:MAG: 4-hydroxythreonine-4-phosphate dehydrogenase PdxA [Rectinemataceae bacterium]|nr:4-hydroxythreonine-4-phosphate dehydrogenase PdxA [Spirochaetaceae bacterium]
MGNNKETHSENEMTERLPVIAITMGDPAGVGPEITAKSLSLKEIYQISNPLVVGDASIMERAIHLIGKPLHIHTIREPNEAEFRFGTIDVLDQHSVELASFEFGKVSGAAGHAAFEAIQKTIELAMAGQVDATVTSPINKEALNLAGYAFSGHTEIYAHYTKTRDYAMMLADGKLRVVHVTTHVPLREACDLIKKERVLSVIKLANAAMQDFGIDRPRIGVAGLNPHASDGGLFGLEERNEIAPAIAEARKYGMDVDGPISPDTLFVKAAGGYYDIVVAMYHDQGHIPVKMIGFIWDNSSHTWKSVRGVNITLGLPIIRTSVDHGTAFDQAWKGMASEESMVEAIRYAAGFSRKHIMSRKGI